MRHYKEHETYWWEGVVITFILLFKKKMERKIKGNVWWFKRDREREYINIYLVARWDIWYPTSPGSCAQVLQISFPFFFFKYKIYSISSLTNTECVYTMYIVYRRSGSLEMFELIRLNDHDEGGGILWWGLILAGLNKKKHVVPWGRKRKGDRCGCLSTVNYRSVVVRCQYNVQFYQ